MPKDENDKIEKTIDKPETVKDKTEHVKELDAKTDVRSHEKLLQKPGVAFLIIAVFISVTLAITIFFAFTAAFTDGRSDPNPVFVDNYSNHMPIYRTHRVFVQTSVASESNNIITSGVVKSVGANSFVIAGNGNQATVNVTGDTVYNTVDKKVTVNDSVVIIGTGSNDAITATDVRIVNM